MRIKYILRPFRILRLVIIVFLTFMLSNFLIKGQDNSDFSTLFLTIGIPFALLLAISYFINYFLPINAKDWVFDLDATDDISELGDRSIIDALRKSDNFAKIG